MPITMIPSISGGANLTTAGRVMIVAGPGVAGQSDVSLSSGIFSRAGTLGLSATGANVIPFSTNGTERGRWSSGGNLVIGGTTDNGQKLQIVNGNILVSDGYGFLYDASGNMQLLGSAAGGFTFKTGGTQKMSLAAAGTLTVYNETATTGVTSLVVRAGAGQSTTGLLTFQINSGSEGMSLSAPFAQNLDITNAGTTYWRFTTTRLHGYSGVAGIAFTDIGIARASAGVLEVNNGSAGTYRDIIARSYIGTAVAAATLANSQFTFHLASNTEFVITAKGDDGTTRTATVALA